MKLIPLGDRIIVAPDAQEEKTKGGIILPTNSQEKPQMGTVVAVGKGRIDENGKLVPMNLTKDDRILFGKYTGTEIKISEQNYLIMHETDVMGRFESEEGDK